MNPFQEFLNANHPALNNAVASDADAGLCALTECGFAIIEGPDTLKFLQGQATCDTAKISTTSGQAGACCNLKGRMYTGFLAAMPAPESLLLRMSSDLLEPTITSLSKYIVFSKAEITASDAVAIGLFGTESADCVAAFFDSAPAEVMASQAVDGGLVIAVDGDTPRFECWLSPARAVEFWAFASQRITPAPQADWVLQNIRAGRAELCAATADEFLPQMLNMQITGGISFTKGCYTGQEVVARMQYRGKVKRRMYRAAVSGPAPAAGDAVTDSDGKNIGDIVNCAPLGADRAEVLAVISNDKAADAHSGNDSKMTILELPYTLPTD